MLNVGKLVVRQVEVILQPAGPSSACVSPPTPVLAPVPEEVCCSSLIYLWDILSNREYLVNSGASVSVFPGLKSTSDDENCLWTADGSPLKCSGSWIIPHRFSCGSGVKVYSWNFQLAPVSVPLL